MLSHPQGPCPILEELIQRLTHEGLLTDHLSLPQGSPELEIQTYMGVGLAPLAVGTAAERLVASAPTLAGTTGDVGLAGDATVATVAAAEGAGVVVEPGLEPITRCDGMGPASCTGPCEAPECGAEGHGVTTSEGTAPHVDPPAAAVRVLLSGQHSHQLHRCARSLQ